MEDLMSPARTATSSFKAGRLYELLATNAMGQVVMATPAISNGVIIVRGLKDVFAIGMKPESGSENCNDQATRDAARDPGAWNRAGGCRT